MSVRTPAKPTPSGRRKRSNGDGTEFYIPERKVWRASRSVVDPTTGKTIRISGEGRSTEEARTRLGKNIARREIKWGVRDPDEIVRTSQTYTVEEWVGLFVAEKPDLRDSTRKQYERLIRLHIVPEFGNRLITTINGHEMRKFIETTLPNKPNPKSTTGALLGEGSTPRAVYWLLNEAFERALLRKYIYENPCRAVENVPQKQAQDKAETSAVRKTHSWLGHMLMTRIQGRDDEARWALAFYGLRQGEVLGLTDDCYIKHKGKARLEVRQQLKKKHQEHGCGYNAKGQWTCGRKTASNCPDAKGTRGVFLDDQTKTAAGVREVAVDDYLMDVLDRHVARQKALRATDSFKPEDGWKMDKLFFTDSKGKARRHTADNSAWHKMLQDEGVYERLEGLGFDQSFRPHLARHITASFLIARGFSNDEIMRLTGWSSAEMLKVYGKAGAEATRRTTASIGDTLRPKATED